MAPVEFEMKMRTLLVTERKFGGERGRAIELAYIALKQTGYAAGAEVFWELVTTAGVK